MKVAGGNGTAILDLKQIYGESVNWIQVAQDKIRWQAVTNTVKIRVPKKELNF
jgi:hypothetical protein